jgi:hypothetical protein
MLQLLRPTLITGAQLTPQTLSIHNAMHGLTEGNPRKFYVGIFPMIPAYQTEAAPRRTVVMRYQSADIRLSYRRLTGPCVALPIGIVNFPPPSHRLTRSAVSREDPLVPT